MLSRRFAYITFRMRVTFDPVVLSALQHRGDLVQVAETRLRLVHSDEGDLVVPCLDERVKNVVDLEDTNKDGGQNGEKTEPKTRLNSSVSPHVDPDVAGLLVDDEGLRIVSESLQAPSVRRLILMRRNEKRRRQKDQEEALLPSVHHHRPGAGR